MQYIVFVGCHVCYRLSYECCDEHVCLSVNISPELHIRSSPFLRTLPVTVSSSGGAAIRYVFPVLWMTSFYTKRPEQATQKGVGLYTQSDLTRPGHGGFDTAV